MKHGVCLALLVGLALGPLGCASSRHHVVLTGDPLVDGPNAIEKGPPEDRVLWEYRTAMAAMRRAEYKKAARMLDSALARVEGSLGTDKTARKSRRVFSSESSKTFLGEPYERVMAYYYRGILYWMNGEPDNARACFRSGQIHDSDVDEKTYASDYVLLDYLDGLVTTKLAGDGSDAFERAKVLRNGRPISEYNLRANALFFIDFGRGPSKVASGEYGERLQFRNNGSPVHSALLKVDQQEMVLGPVDDLYYQASTRGGRVMDHVLGRQAVFKKTTDAVGTAAIVTGSVMAHHNRRNSNIGMGLVLAGLASKLVSAAANPRADTRTWDNLPLFLTFTALELPPGPHTATVEFRDEAGRVLPNLTKSVHFQVPVGSGDTVVYLNDQSKNPQSL